MLRLLIKRKLAGAFWALCGAALCVGGAVSLLIALKNGTQPGPNYLSSKIADNCEHTALLERLIRRPSRGSNEPSKLFKAKQTSRVWNIPALLLLREPDLSSRLQKRMCNSSASCDRRAGGCGSLKLLARFLSDKFGLVVELCTTSDSAL